ncbi:MAG: glycosyl hydrolase family 8 [Pseudomonadota bacterium]
MARTCAIAKRDHALPGLMCSLVTTLFLAVFVVVGAAPAHALTSPLHGQLKGSALWESYKARFTTADGRVVDNANKNISHSEGQGFAMIAAVAADDPATFSKLWTFTKTRLGVRKDALFAWKYQPNRLFKVKDKNNATDGDLIIAWALLEAAHAGFGRQYSAEANAILRDLKKLVRRDSAFGLFLRPAAYGFSPEHQKGREVINLSYWVFPAFERIARLTNDPFWRALTKSGERLIQVASQNAAGLPADWSALKLHTGRVGTAPNFDKRFSYNAVRIPLYLAWNGKGDASTLATFRTNWMGRSRSLAHIDVDRNRIKGTFKDRGYHAIAALVNCSLSGTRFPDRLRAKLDTLYYPASLHLLSVIAIKQRYPQCW